MSSSWITPMQIQLPGGERGINQSREHSLRSFPRKRNVLEDKRSQHELHHPRCQSCSGKRPELFLELWSMETSTLTTLSLHVEHHFFKADAPRGDVLKEGHPVGITNVLSGWGREARLCRTFLTGPWDWDSDPGFGEGSVYYFCLFLNERRWFKDSGGQELFQFSYP